ncbi:MAG: hypothetical protein MUC91_12900 [Verrucomicrobia bacterium]|nr:hypothetical protein [Verrucomicrobiota bacterium]
MIVGLLKPIKAERERERFYLFAGMGGRPARRRHRAFLLASVIVAAAVSLLLVALFLWIHMG